MNSHALTLPKNQWPTLIVATGPKAETRFLEFFTAQIRNPNTRKAYFRAVTRFFAWCESRGLTLNGIHPIHCAAYVEHLGTQLSAPSVKQHLAAIKMLCDWLVTGQIIEFNPASSVRGPRHVVKRGKARSSPPGKPASCWTRFPATPPTLEDCATALSSPPCSFRSPGLARLPR